MDAGNVARTIFYSSALLLRAPGMLIKYKMRRRGAVNTFKRELIACGVPVGEAEKLSRAYPFDLGDLMSLMRNEGFNLRPS
ncbi:hypothetical protein E2P65_05070 [Candidatus Bathyarchaeota archaeon]|nr:hypothetical protein E2P65_05070 [Candidatus Bathyarchaeota archaeon]